MTSRREPGYTGREMGTGEVSYAFSFRELASLLGGEPRLRALLAGAGCAPPPPRLPPDQVRRLLASLGHAYRPRVLAFLNLKGGVGKTTSAIHLATRAAQYGYRVCLLDLDSQASATVAFDQVPADDDPVFLDVWPKPGELLAGSLRQVAPGLHLLPSALENGLLETALASPAAQKRAVAGVCRALIRQGFDLLICDCPPSLGTAVISSICAADTLVVPLGDDPFSFKGLELTLAEATSICETFGLQPPGVRLLLTRLDARLGSAERAWRRLEREYGELLVPVPVRTSSEFAKALEKRRTVFAWHRNTPAHADYDAVTRHLLGLDAVLGTGTGPSQGG